MNVNITNKKCELYHTTDFLHRFWTEKAGGIVKKFIGETEIEYQGWKERYGKILIANELDKYKAARKSFKQIMKSL